MQAVTDVLDGVLDVAVASFAWWSLVYAGMLLGMSTTGAGWLWALGTAGVVALRSRARWYPAPADVAGRSAGGALAVAVGMAALSSVVSRPEWDDAAFVIRSTFVADHGTVPQGDMIFTDDRWPATFGAVPHLSSIETLLGAVARWTGALSGDVVYRWFVPVATFGAVWSAWLLFRVLRARRPAASLTLAMTMIVLGGYAHASWGNFHLARMWQGKVVLVALLVPYLYAVLAALLGDRSRGRLVRPAGLLLLVGVGAAGVGLSSTGVFLVPLVAAAGVAWCLVERRWLDVVTIVASASVFPMVAGVVTVLSPVGARNEAGRTTEWLWSRVLADSLVAAVVVVAVLVVLVGVVRPRWAGVVDPPRQRLLAGAAVTGLVFTLPPLYPVLTALMGGDAIAYRLAWVVPVPILVGLLASLPARRWGLPVVPAVAGALAVILAVGQPLWAASNMAHLGKPGTWKVRDQADLAAARWIVEQQPEGRYLAASWVTMMTGVLTSELRPVGTRIDYVASLDEIPGSQVEERLLLQGVADGVESRLPENRDPALAALDALDVEVACVAWDDAFTQDLFGTAGYVPAYLVGPWTCWDRTPAPG